MTGEGKAGFLRIYQKLWDAGYLEIRCKNLNYPILVFSLHFYQGMSTKEARNPQKRNTMLGIQEATGSPLKHSGEEGKPSFKCSLLPFMTDGFDAGAVMENAAVNTSESLLNLTYRHIRSGFSILSRR
jgi:hypothetical protein